MRPPFFNIKNLVSLTGVQVKKTVVDKAVQCDILTAPTPMLQHPAIQIINEKQQEEKTELEDQPSSQLQPLDYDLGDPVYTPGSLHSDSAETSDESEFENQQTSPEKEEKFLVFSSSLSKLFHWCRCPSCGSPDFKLRRQTFGTMLTVKLECGSCKKINTWKSQPYVGSFPAGNVLLSGAILFSGAISCKVLHVLEHLKVACITRRTYFRHQKFILSPTVEHVWQHQ